MSRDYAAWSSGAKAKEVREILKQDLEYLDNKINSVTNLKVLTFNFNNFKSSNNLQYGLYSYTIPDFANKQIVAIEPEGIFYNTNTLYIDVVPQNLTGKVFYIDV